jgi:phage tail protein X
MNIRTYADTAVSHALWIEYVDTESTMTEAEFASLSIAQKIATQVAAFGPEPAYYMNPKTGSVDTLDGWHPYGLTDGLIEVVSDGNGGWIEADTLTTAALICTASKNSTDAMERAAAAHGESDQDWDAETTRYTFADGSGLIVSGSFFDCFLVE